MSIINMQTKKKKPLHLDLWMRSIDAESYEKFKQSIINEHHLKIHQMIANIGMF